MDEGKFNDVAMELVKDNVPGASIFYSIFRAFVPDNNEAFRHAMLTESFGEMLKLKDLVARINRRLAAAGIPEECFTPTEAAHVFHKLAEGQTGAYGPEKRAAVTNATAWQFDPSLATKAVRKHWLDVVAGLSAEEVLAASFLANHDYVLIIEELREVWWSETDAWREVNELHEVPAIEAVPLTGAMIQLQRRGFIREDRKEVRLHLDRHRNFKSNPFVKLPAFDTLVKFISEPREASDEDTPA